MKQIESKIFVGTSGFSYPHWRGSFYPADLPQKDWFLYYTKYFDTVELNASFYQLPRREIFAGWRKKADKSHPPAGSFAFAIKGWRWITHIKKLKNCQEELKKFFEAANELNPAMSNIKYKTSNMVLWQLPPSLKADGQRLADFLPLLPSGWRYAFEFRHPSWGEEGVWKILRQFGAAVVFQDYPEWPIFEEITADFVYLRFHGRTSLYSSCYTEKELKTWAGKIKKWASQGLDVYAYFNNDALGYAVENAQRLKQLLEK